MLAGAVLAESDPNVAGALRWALARTGCGALASVASGMDSEDVHIRRRSVLAIAEMSSDGARAALSNALGDSDPAVRRHAALAVGRRGGTAAVPTLVTLVVEGVNDVEAAEVLGGLSQNLGCTDHILTALVDELACSTNLPMGSTADGEKSAIAEFQLDQVRPPTTPVVCA